MKHFITILLFCLIVESVFANQEKVVNLFVESQHKESESGLVSDTVHGRLITFVTLESKPDQVIVHWLYQVANFGNID